MSVKVKVTRGEKWAADVRAEFDLNLAQDVLVTEAARIMDVIASLDDVREQRAQQVVLLRALSALALPDVGSDEPQTPGRLRARKAARSRWEAS